MTLNPIQVEHYREFKEIDRNVDNKVEFDEFKEYMIKKDKRFGHGEQSLKRIFKLIDQNGNGVIEFSEYDRFLKIVEKLDFKKEKDAHRFIFRILDLNGDNQINKFEFTRYIGIFEIELDGTLDEYFGYVDRNGDGFVDEEEFLKFSLPFAVKDFNDSLYDPDYVEEEY